MPSKISSTLTAPKESSPALSLKSPPATHRLVGGLLCLDFANTLNGHRVVPGNEYLSDYADLVLWSRHAGILDEKDTLELLSEGERHRHIASDTYSKAIDLRELIYRIFSCISSEYSPDPNDLDQLSALRLGMLSHSILEETEDGFRWIWKPSSALDKMLWPVIESALDLLTSRQIGNVKQCSGGHCDWLFLDSSRNHLRRWCSMDACGNRDKMRRRYKRKKNK